MKLIIFLTVVATITICSVTSSPIKKDGRGVLINRPTKEEIFNSKITKSEIPGVFYPRNKRSRPYGYERVHKYHRFVSPETYRYLAARGVFDTRLVRSAVHPETKAVKGESRDRALNVRKGEYICGDRVCKLKPGEVPKNCKNCQYRTM